MRTGDSYNKKEGEGKGGTTTTPSTAKNVTRKDKKKSATTTASRKNISTKKPPPPSCLFVCVRDTIIKTKKWDCILIYLLLIIDNFVC